MIFWHREWFKTKHFAPFLCSNVKGWCQIQSPFKSVERLPLNSVFGSMSLIFNSGFYDLRTKNILIDYEYKCMEIIIQGHKPISLLKPKWISYCSGYTYAVSQTHAGHSLMPGRIVERTLEDGEWGVFLFLEAVLLRKLSKVLGLDMIFGHKAVEIFSNTYIHIYTWAWDIVDGL